MLWIVDGNNVYGSRPDGWWNDRSAAAARFTQRVAEWCRTHDDEVLVVFDAPASPSAIDLAGGNLRVVEARRRGRNGADDEIIEIIEGLDEEVVGSVTVVTSDRGLRSRLPDWATVVGVGRFRDRIDY